MPTQRHPIHPSQLAKKHRILFPSRASLRARAPSCSTVATRLNPKRPKRSLAGKRFSHAVYPFLVISRRRPFACPGGNESTRELTSGLSCIPERWMMRGVCRVRPMIAEIIVIVRRQRPVCIVVECRCLTSKLKYWSGPRYMKHQVWSCLCNEIQTRR